MITPGPWKALIVNDGKAYCDGIVEVASLVADDEFSFYDNYIVQTDSGAYGPKPDDANLIAVAPEMLSMLERLNDVIQRGGDFRMGPSGRHHGIDDELSALIQKARGGQ